MEDFNNIIIIILIFILTAIAYLIAKAFVIYCLYADKYPHIKNKYRKSATHDFPLFYSTYFIKKETLRQVLRFKPSRLHALYALAIKNPLLAKKTATRARPDLHHKKYQEWLLLCAELEMADNNCNQCYEYFQKIMKPKALPRPLQARFLYLTARYEFFQTDMKNAAEHITRAIQIYKNKKYTAYQYEYGECISTMGQIYRISGMHDAAFSLFNEAQKVYQTIACPPKEIETNAYLGLLEIGQENYALAQDYLEEAYQKATRQNMQKTQTDIKNWQGLIFYLQKDYVASQKSFTEALKAAQALHTKTFSTEMLARLYYTLKEEKKALTYINQAIDYNNKLARYSGIFENQYLKAEIYFNHQDYKKSKDILNLLIKNNQYKSSTYDIANAYTLLGAIEFKQNNLNRAHTLFMQALDLEHSKDRLKGAAVDYNNLAEIARCTGDKETSEKYLKQALLYATQTNDTELAEFIKTKLDNLPEKQS